MQDPKKQNLTYDYAKLDEYLTKMIDPDTLDQSFRGFHTAFTLILQLLVCTGEMQELSFKTEATEVRDLDELFQILGQLKKVELSPQEEADIKRWRTIERVVELKGDKKALEHHRKNLKSMFEAERIAMKGDKDLIRGIEKTWKALDSELEADIIFADSLIPKDL